MANNTRIETDVPRGAEDVPHGEFPSTRDSDRLARFIPPTMLREGDYWTILYRGRLLRVRHNKGLTYLAQLIAHPWESVHVSELYGKERGAAAPEGERTRPVESDRKAVTSRVRAALGSIQSCDLALGEHLLATISTGRFCCYSPRPESAVR